MYSHQSRRVGDYVDSLVVDHVPRNDRAGNRRDAEDINPGRTRGRCIFGIGAVAGNMITNDDATLACNRNWDVSEI